MPPLLQTKLVFGLRLSLSSPPGPAVPIPIITLPVPSTPSASSHVSTKSRTSSSVPSSAGAYCRGTQAAKKLVVDQDHPVQAKVSLGWCNIKLNLSVRLVEVDLTERRMMYTYEQKTAILEQTKHMEPVEAAKRVQTIRGYEKVTAKDIRRWRIHDLEDFALAQASGGLKRQRQHGGGRRVNMTYEAAVVDELIFTSLELVDGKEKAVVQANVAFSHALIIRAAQKVQRSLVFKDDPNVLKLKHNRSWIRGMLGRHALRRRRITANEKVLPEPEVVQARMTEIQETITTKKFTKNETISADETGIFFGAPLKFQYVPPDAARATAPES